MLAEATEEAARHVSRAALAASARWRDWLTAHLQGAAGPVHKLLQPAPQKGVSDFEHEGHLVSTASELLEFEASAWSAIWCKHSLSDAKANSC